MMKLYVALLQLLCSLPLVRGAAYINSSFTPSSTTITESSYTTLTVKTESDSVLIGSSYSTITSNSATNASSRELTFSVDSQSELSPAFTRSTYSGSSFSPNSTGKETSPFLSSSKTTTYPIHTQSSHRNSNSHHNNTKIGIAPIVHLPIGSMVEFSVAGPEQDPFTDAYCKALWSSNRGEFLKTASYSAEVTTYTDASYGSLKNLPSTQVDRLYNSAWSFAYSSPCCGGCTLDGGDVQLYYWPSGARKSNATTVVYNSFTFTSPSWYLAFGTFSVYNYCGSIYNPVAMSTIAYDPDVTLYSTPAVYYQTLDDFQWTPTGSPFSWSIFNYTDVGSNCANVTASFCSYEFYSTAASFVDKNSYIYCTKTPSYPGSIATIVTWTFSYSPCTPVLYGPGLIDVLDWYGGPTSTFSCTQGTVPFVDPPHALLPESSLSQLTQTPVLPVGPSRTPAQAGDPPKSPTPTPTSPTGSPTAEPDHKPYDPPNRGPQKPNSQSEQSPSTRVADTPPYDPSTVVANPPPGSTKKGADQSLDYPPPSTFSSSSSPPPYRPLYTVGSQTVEPGGPPVIVSGTTYYIPPSSTGYVIINGVPSTLPLPSFKPTPTLPPFTIGSQTVTPGGPVVVISGTTYYIPASSTGYVIINGVPSTITIPAPESPAKPQYTIDGQVLTPGGSAVIVSGTTWSLPPSATFVLANGSPVQLPTQNPPPGTDPPGALSINPSQTLTAGQILTISGETISLATAASGIPDGVVIASGTITTTVPLGQYIASAIGIVIHPSQALTVGEIMTISGETISLETTTGGVPDGVIVASGTITTTVPLGQYIASAMGIIIDPTQTLTVGEILTVSGETISLATTTGGVPDGVIIASSTFTETVPLGVYIASGMGLLGLPAATAATATSTGVEEKYGGTPFSGDGGDRARGGLALRWGLWAATGFAVLMIYV